MSKLNFSTEPYELDLPYGIKITVKPLTQPSMLAAQAAARKKLNHDYGDEEREDRDGLYQTYLISELANRHITHLIVQEQQAPVTTENIKTVMDLYPVGERFFQLITVQQVILNASKNVLRVSANGTSNQAAAQNIAVDAAN